MTSAMALDFDSRQLEREQDTARSRRGMTWSVALHAVLLLWIALARPAERERETLTEITLLGPGDMQAAGEPAPAAMSRATEPSPGSTVAASADEHFRRESRPATIDPAPQSESAVMDRLNARLAALQSNEVTPLASGLAVGAPPVAWSVPSAAVGTGGSGQSPVALTRGGAGSGSAPIALSRGGGSSLAPAIGVGTAPGLGATSAPATPSGGDATARRTLAGVSLAGPIADRAIVRSAKPAYPDWALRDGVEGSVTLYFVVRADGTVKENILVQKTAGFGDFDDNARAALRDWRFEPLARGRTGEQWGTITFHYRLRGA